MTLTYTAATQEFDGRSFQSIIITCADTDQATRVVDRLRNLSRSMGMLHMMHKARIDETTVVVPIVDAIDRPNITADQVLAKMTAEPRFQNCLNLYENA